jgi:hypothetical protein
MSTPRRSDPRNIPINVLNCRGKFFIGVSREERGTLRRVTFVLRVGNNKVTPLVKKKVLGT